MEQNESKTIGKLPIPHQLPVPPDVMPYVIIHEGNVKFMVGVPVMAGHAFDTAAFQADPRTKPLTDIARQLINVIAENTENKGIGMLEMLAPSFNTLGRITALQSSADETPDEQVQCIEVPNTTPPQLTIAYDPKSKEFWIGDSPTIVQYVLQTRGLASPPASIPRAIVEAMAEMGENMPEWIKKAQEICGLTEEEKAYFATLKFEGLALSILVKTLKAVMTTDRPAE